MRIGGELYLLNVRLICDYRTRCCVLQSQRLAAMKSRQIIPTTGTCDVVDC